MLGGLFSRGAIERDSVTVCHGPTYLAMRGPHQADAWRATDILAQNAPR
jgi:hypothetical protein